MWDFIKRHTSGPSTKSPPHILSSDDEDHRDGTTGDGDDQDSVAGDGSAKAS